jgi:transposase
MGQDDSFDHQPKRGGSAMKVTTLGIDLAKNIFRVHGCDARGKAVVSKALTRRQLIIFMAQLPPRLVGIEACRTSNYWAREIRNLAIRCG